MVDLPVPLEVEVVVDSLLLGQMHQDLQPQVVRVVLELLFLFPEVH
tara:strand:+ start:161 stop:298 length:138 start_codon:yes stop_codon:yes gene_type:complete